MILSCKVTSFISSFFSNDKIESAIYICDFHREQAWERWLSKSSNGLLNEKQKVLAKLRAIAKARTEEEYRHRLSDVLSLAESIPSSNVTVIDMENGEFLVKSQSRLEEKKMYKVMFGTKQPSCECFDWERQRLPCKHFFAVFQHVPSWSFDRLPKEYRDSPFFSVDRDVLLAGEKEEDDGMCA